MDEKRETNYLTRISPHTLTRRLRGIIPYKIFWEIFKNCQLQTLLNFKSLRFSENFIITIWWENIMEYEVKLNFGQKSLDGIQGRARNNK